MPINIDMATNSNQLQKCLEARELSPSKLQEITSQRKEFLEQVKANTKKAQEEYYDQKHANPATYKVSTKVLKDFCRKRHFIYLSK